MPWLQIKKIMKVAIVFFIFLFFIMGFLIFLPAQRYYRVVSVIEAPIDLVFERVTNLNAQSWRARC